MQPHQGLPYPQRVWAILTVFCGLIMAVLDGSIANIALPSISRELNAEAASTIWVVNAYQLTVTICLLPLSSLGDILGYKRVYRTGLAIFLIGSLIAACAVNLPMLVAARVIQGIGGAGIMSVNTALVRFIYPPTKLGRGIGLNALVVGVTIAVGPSLGALILGISSWQWLFAVNVPVAIVALWISRWALPDTPAQPRAFDYPSAVLSAVVFGMFILGVDSMGGRNPVDSRFHFPSIRRIATASGGIVCAVHLDHFSIAVLHCALARFVLLHRLVLLLGVLALCHALSILEFTHGAFSVKRPATSLRQDRSVASSPRASPWSARDRSERPCRPG